MGQPRPFQFIQWTNEYFCQPSLHSGFAEFNANQSIEFVKCGNRYVWLSNCAKLQYVKFVC